MNKYRYIGKVRTAVGDTALYRNGVFELDPKNKQVQSLLAQGLLVDASGETPEQAPKSPAKKTTKK